MAAGLLLETTANGLYCAAGDFFVDPWQPVGRAIITHAHSDHLRWGASSYLCVHECAPLARLRLNDEAHIESVAYGETISIGGVSVSFHPAGHILGSAQIRLEHGGEVWVVSGDYKRGADRTCAGFELVQCHTFITESTFGMPIYDWPDPEVVFREINEWWEGNRALGMSSIVFAYSLGKAQRVLAALDPSVGPVCVHGAVERFLPAYRAAGIALPETAPVAAGGVKGRALVVAPPSAAHTPWLRRFGQQATSFASGWMAIRGVRRRRAVDKGFVLSDHVDWKDLLRTIAETGASRVFVTHGYTAPVVRWLSESGIEAHPLETEFEGDELEEAGETPAVEAAHEAV